jgi:RNA polymerase sigma-70 factor (ECF subfamily)
MKTVFNINSITDFELMERIQQSDEHAFRMLFNRHWEVLYVFSCSIIEDRVIAKDITQEVWISLWERRKKIKNDNIKAYLFKAIRFRVYKELRDNKKLNSQIELIDSIISSTNTDDIINLADTNNTVQESINQLPPRSKEVFELSRFEGLSNQEISDKLGISKRTVETHISNSLKHLRRDIVIALLLSVSASLQV